MRRIPGFMRGAAYAASVRVCHDIGYVECRAAFARKRRAGSFGLSDQSRCRQQLERDWERFHIISVTPELIRRAAALAEDHGVRAYDSVHLAAAEAAYGMARGRTGFRFAAFDAKLIEAARRISLPMLSPVLFTQIFDRRTVAAQIVDDAVDRCARAFQFALDRRTGHREPP